FHRGRCRLARAGVWSMPRNVDLPGLGPSLPTATSAGNSDVLVAAKPPSLAPLLPSPDDSELQKIVKKAALWSAALGVAVKIAPLAPKTVSTITHLVTGFDIVPGKGVVAKPGVFLWLAPPPIGIVPARWYGMPPEADDLWFWVRGVTSRGEAEKNRQQIRDRMARETEADLAQYLSVLPGRTDAALLNDLDQLNKADAYTPALQQRRKAAAEEALRRGLITQAPAVERSPISAAADLAAASPSGQVAPARAGGVTGIKDPVLASSLGLIVATITGIDQFFAANPPDP
ncbi:MAG: hypothetical protein LLG14_23015, partial [Nocardiaceae bacterium]|nr:hypothetical protein [Nocardiaceae bacterium]